MKRKTLQEQYNQIKKGKGSKEIFLKEAKKTFPNYIHNVATFNQAEKILKQKSIISENMWGVTTGKNEQPDWFKIFNENINTINEEVDYSKMHNVELNATYKEKFGVKDTKGLTRDELIKALKSGKAINEAKVEEKKTSKEVTDLEEKNFDYKDKKDVNNVYGEAFLKGYYTEMKDPKNAEKTVNEIKEIVAKNLAKDQLHYVKDGQFGEKGVGYTDEHPGLKASKSDQMEKVKLKENKEYFESSNSSSRNQFINWVKKTTKKEFNDSNQDDLMDLAIRWSKEDQFEWEDPFKDEKNVRAFVQATMMDDQKTLKESRFKLRENLETHDSKKSKPKKKKVKKETIETKLAEIDKASSIVALETKIEALAEIIESKMQRLSMVSEDESLSELVDKKKMKEMQKEIKLLEKRKAGFEKLYEKSCGKKYQQQEIIGGVTEEEEIEENNKKKKNNNTNNPNNPNYFDPKGSKYGMDPKPSNYGVQKFQEEEITESKKKS